MLQQSLFENEVSEKSPSSQGGSRANLIALQENVKRLLMSVTCGQSSGELLAKLRQDGFWEKMYQGYSQVTIDGSLEEYSMTWPKWGTLLGGQLTELLTLELTTNETGSLLWRTPLATDGEKAGHGNLPHQVKMWPTPTTQEIEHKDLMLTKTGRRRTKYGKNSHSVGLADYVKMWPTPTASQDYKPVRPLAPSEANGTHGTMLVGAVGDANPELIGGQLNPEFVEWLMEFPIGWTDLNA